ncbi:hypothetical protein [Synechococcus sp. M16CYN]|uniref:hypothetical protein n=1 Tax=Synechococcus sp. M16CYN TaxID=3103139 RepID=UPI00334032CC
MSSNANAAALYEQISKNPEQTQALFRQALQDPGGAMKSICDLGDQLGLPVTATEVRRHLANLDDEDSKRWLVKARGGF